MTSIQGFELRKRGGQFHCRGKAQVKLARSLRVLIFHCRDVVLAASRAPVIDSAIRAMLSSACAKGLLAGDAGDPLDNPGTSSDRDRGLPVLHMLREYISVYWKRIRGTDHFTVR